MSKLCSRKNPIIANATATGVCHNDSSAKGIRCSIMFDLYYIYLHDRVCSRMFVCPHFDVFCTQRARGTSHPVIVWKNQPSTHLLPQKSTHFTRSTCTDKNTTTRHMALVPPCSQNHAKSNPSAQQQMTDDTRDTHSSTAKDGAAFSRSMVTS